MTKNQWLIIGVLTFAVIAILGCLTQVILYEIAPESYAKLFTARSILEPTKTAVAVEQAAPTETPKRIQQPPTSLPTKIPTALPTNESAIRFTNDNWGLALSDAGQYANAPVILTGKIFLNPEIGNGMVAFQMYTIKGATDGNTIVIVNGSSNVKTGDYVRVAGKIYDQFEGQNAFGATLRVPRILATKVDLISREDAIAPALKQYTINQPISQYGLVITLVRVDIAKEETRFYVKVQNQSKYKASVYTFDADLQQGTKQYKAKSLYDSGYPDLPSDMLTGVEAETVIVFDAISPTGTIKFIWDGPQTQDYSLDFKPYSWDITLK